MRTSKAVAVLDKHQAALKTEHQRLIAELAGIEATLERLKDMRAAMEALPKRTSRSKRTVALPAQPPAAA